MNKRKALPSQERLQELFDYSYITGELYYKVSPNPINKVGSVAGTVGSTGYKCVMIDRKRYKTQRIIWMLVTGVDPGELDVDHLNRIRTNNAWHNLELKTSLGNNLNKSNVVTPYITFFKQRAKYSVIKHGEKFGGYYNTLEEAKAKVNELGWYYYEM